MYHELPDRDGERTRSVFSLINDAPYGTEKAYNALRLAMNLQKEHADVQVNVFLMAELAAWTVAADKVFTF